MATMAKEKGKKHALDPSDEPPTPEMQQEVDELNRHIKAKGLKWKAGVTPLTRLSLEERKKFGDGHIPSIEERARAERNLIDRYIAEGLDPSQIIDGSGTPLSSSSAAPTTDALSPPATSSTYTYSGLMSASSLPPILDYRNFNGGNYVTSAKSQICNGCWAYTSTALLESRVLLDLNMPGVNLDLSDRLTVACSGSGSCNGGEAVKDFFVNTGLAAESYSPLKDICSNAGPGWQLDVYKIGGWQYVPYNTVEDIKAALNTYGPMYASLTLFFDFYQYTSGVYSWSKVPMNYMYHAMELIGYDDENSCFIF
jgi:hypothetical protein